MKGGSDAGMGKGMISSSMMNFRAIVNIIGPYFSAGVCDRCKRHWPGLTFVAASATVVAAGYASAQFHCVTSGSATKRLRPEA